MNLFAQNLAKPLVLTHAISAFIAAATAIHLALHARSGFRRGSFPARGKTYGSVMAIAFGVCVASGLAAYPNFRVNVRGLFLDRFAPAMTAVFEIKENMGAMVIPVVALALVLERASRRESDGSARLFVATSWLTAVVLATCVVMGLLVTMEHGVG